MASILDVLYKGFWPTRWSQFGTSIPEAPTIKRPKQQDPGSNLDKTLKEVMEIAAIASNSKPSCQCLSPWLYQNSVYKSSISCGIEMHQLSYPTTMS